MFDAEFFDVLIKSLEGWAGVFVVTAIIVVLVFIFSKLFKK